MSIPKPYEGDYRGNERLGKFVSKLVPGDWLILSKLGKWYSANPCHKFDLGDILILTNRRRLGYGIRPVIQIEDYQLRDSRSTYPYKVEGYYLVTTHRDIFGDFDIWANKNKIPKGVERISERSLIFKHNIEYGFKKVNCKNIEDAVKLYKSVEVDPKSMGFTAEQISTPLNPGEVSFSRGFLLDDKEI